MPRMRRCERIIHGQTRRAALQSGCWSSTAGNSSEECGQQPHNFQREDSEMRRSLTLRAGIVFVLTASAHIAFAEDAPKDNQGYTTPKTVVIDLGKEIPGMAGWQLRLRVLNIAPGGHIGLHNH